MEKVLVVLGPTAVGKSKLGIYLAQQLEGEIINGDAMQVYRGMNIGTAKVTVEEMQGIPHHLIDILDIDESYDVVRFQSEVRKCITQIHQRGKLPVLVGGTGLYLKAALYDYTFETHNKNKEQAIQNELDALTNEQLMAKLNAIDPISAQKIDVANRRRLQRALMIYFLTGQTKSAKETEQDHRPLYDVVWLGLTLPREDLHRRQDERLELMMKAGLEDEVKRLFGPNYSSNSTSAQAIGYKELFPYFKGEQTREQALTAIRHHTHQYTKRQMTWFNHQLPVHWIEVDKHFSSPWLQDVLQWTRNELMKKRDSE